MKLTETQRLLLSLIRDGKSSKEMTELTGLTGPTIAYRLTEARKILNANNSTHAVVKAIKLGVIPLGNEAS